MSAFYTHKQEWTVEEKGQRDHPLVSTTAHLAERQRNGDPLPSSAFDGFLRDAHLVDREHGSCLARQPSDRGPTAGPMWSHELRHRVTHFV